MHAVDTNILARYFRLDDERQSPIAAAVMARGTVFCPKTVLVEFEMVMRYVYEHSREEIAACMEALINLHNTALEDEQHVADAMRHYRAGLDFADAMHLASSHRCEVLATFDKKFSKRAAQLELHPPVVDAGAKT